MPSIDYQFKQQQPDNKGALPTGSGGGSARSWLMRALMRADPLLQFDWDVTIQVGGLSFKPEYVETVTVPGPQITTEPVFRAGTKLYVATTTEVSALSMRMYEDVHLTALKFLRTWYGLIVRPNGDRGLPIEYKGYVEVRPTTPQGEEIARIRCIGVFPTQLPPFTGTSEGERSVYDVEFSCDAVEVEFLR